MAALEQADADGAAELDGVGVVAAAEDQPGREGATHGLGQFLAFGLAALFPDVGRPEDLKFLRNEAFTGNPKN